MVTYQLLQCLKEVTFCYTTMTWSKTFPETLFAALKKLFLPRRASKLCEYIAISKLPLIMAELYGCSLSLHKILMDIHTSAKTT